MNEDGHKYTFIHEDINGFKVVYGFSDSVSLDDVLEHFGYFLRAISFNIDSIEHVTKEQ